MNAVYSNKKSTHQSASFQFPYFITFGRESLPHQCNQGNRIIYSFTGVMFYKVVQHKSWRCKWRNSNAKLLTCSEINDQKQCACCHVSRGAGVPSVSHSHSKAFRLLSQTVRLPIQQHELPAVCCMLTVQVSCNQDFEYSKKNNNKQTTTTTTKTWKSLFWRSDLSDPGCVCCVRWACFWPCCIFPPLCCWEPSTSRPLETRNPPTRLWWTSSARSETAIYIRYSFFYCFLRHISVSHLSQTGTSVND